jgi:hypothetical protein
MNRCAKRANREDFPPQTDRRTLDDSSDERLINNDDGEFHDDVDPDRPLPVHRTIALGETRRAF